MAYAAVPLYAMFCQVTGYGGTTQRVEQYSDRVLDRKITVRFDANVAGLPWDFKPVARDMTMKIGETAQAHLHGDQPVRPTPIAGRATYNVTPEMAGAYFNKVECFCFTDTTLKPGETLDMPVVFFVDPDIADVPELKNITTITLSYTFFPIDVAKPVAAAPQAGGDAIQTNDRRKSRGLTWRTRHAKPQARLPHHRPEPVAVHRLDRRADHGHRRRRLDAVHEGQRVPPVRPEHRHAVAVLHRPGRSCSTPCSAGGRTSIKEGHEGDHTPVVSLDLRYGMILFIASEVMFFVAWFWAFFDASLFPGEAAQYARDAFTGGVWPPKGIEVLDPFHLPLLNTMILLLSGTTVTWAHHALLHNDRKGLVNGLVLTVVLGVLFSIVQAYEYIHAPFTFHGLDLRLDLLHGDRLPRLPRADRHDLPDRLPDPRRWAATSRPQQHFGFEAAAWYWHFVDVVWLFLFASIYVWASAGATIAAGH